MRVSGEERQAGGGIGYVERKDQNLYLNRVKLFKVEGVVVGVVLG